METQAAGDPETQTQGDHDSAADDLSSVASTSASTFASSSFYDYAVQYGRTYHAPRDGVFYPFPNDEKEQARLDLNHTIYLKMNDSRLYRSSVVRPARVLDSLVEWFAVSPIQPNWIAPNCKFYAQDLQKDWNLPYKFNFIYARDLFCSIRDPTEFVRRAFENLRPGGWFEIQDFGLPESDDRTIKPDSSYDN
ncbi:hypothetical protein AYL99_12117 [Fonsecaea erecta]|uniref:Methyltransferase type 11 domain-containing protein n=1 Tax=Fonsecaea erecta TaxID=1367422 RepID=A0A178Z1Z7_9EURO|nr:hypothetical protein AYL99_12117 [Fonsecaea erecta]OAP53704.1 hypothetical protein AYL99_12117 [Fonsecaea erecta]